MYKIKVERVDDAFHFVGTNERGNTVHMDISQEAGGRGAGAGPMQLLIMAVGGCSGIDILSILQKGRQEVEYFGVELTAEERAEVNAAFEARNAGFRAAYFPGRERLFSTAGADEARGRDHPDDLADFQHAVRMLLRLARTG